ncbi:hypothetical protein [Nocardia wallacei]|uniref:hypothetical protein n=1 Tax=Nocardia wallacei TaxID=480035 RepID=UPI002455FB03|nr:hypothetical protein [Nocardia wallacei]
MPRLPRLSDARPRHRPRGRERRPGHGDRGTFRMLARATARVVVDRTPAMVTSAAPLVAIPACSGPGRLSVGVGNVDST